VSDRKIRILSSGSGPPLVFVHGLGASADWWLWNLPEFARSFSTYAIDLPGSGKSSGCASIEEIEAPELFLKVLFDALDLTSAVVIGHSMGGYLSARFAMAYPHQVAELVLVDSAGFGSIHHPLLRAMTLPLVGEILTRAGSAGTAFFIRSLFYNKNKIPPQLMEMAQIFARRSSFSKNFLGLLRAGVTPTGAWKLTFIADSLKRINAPLLIIWGDQDPIFPVKQCLNLRQSLPEAHIHVFEQCGHVPQLEYPSEFVAVVSHFLLK